MSFPDFQRAANVSDASDARQRWIVPYADLVTLLLALFIVLYASADKNRATQVANSFASTSASGEGVLPAAPSSGSDENSKAVAGFGEGILDGFRVKHRPGEVTLTLDEATFFESGTAELQPEARESVARVAAELDRLRGKIRVDGHTDAIPISNSSYKSNWELSTARAASVLSVLIDAGIEPERLSAAGYGGFKPVGDNSTPEGRAKNRRVEIVIKTADKSNEEPASEQDFSKVLPQEADKT